MSHKRIALVVLFVLAALPLSRVDAQLRRGNAAPQNQTSQLTLTPAAGAQAAQGAQTGVQAPANQPIFSQGPAAQAAQGAQGTVGQGAAPRAAQGAVGQGAAGQRAAVQGAAPQAAQGAAQGGGTAPSADDFVIPPNASVEELLKKADSLMNADRKFDTEDAYKAWVGNMIQTVFKIANQILATPGIDDETYIKAINLKGQMIYAHGTTRPDAFDVYEKYVRSLRNDQRLMASEEGRKIADSHMAGFLHWGCTKTVQSKGSAEEMKKYIDEFQELVLRVPEYGEMIPELVYPISEFSIDKKDPQLFKAVLGDFVQALKNSDNPQLKSAAMGLEGMIRFADLEGKPFSIAGCLPDGDKFNAEPLKGKYVLVNFWATWATPCLVQYPDLLALYVQYHDKGFEIVGFSIDDDIAKLKDYTSSKNIPWTNLSAKATQDKNLPLISDFYGITNIPTMILIGPDGKVLANDISMDNLKTKLAELLK